MDSPKARNVKDLHIQQCPSGRNQKVNKVTMLFQSLHHNPSRKKTQTSVLSQLVVCLFPPSNGLCKASSVPNPTAEKSISEFALQRLLNEFLPAPLGKTN